MSERGVDPMAEHGDRAAFLDRIRSRQGRPTGGGAHPPPPAPGVVPELAYRTLDGIDAADPDALLPVFVAAVRAAEATIDVVDGDVGADLAPAREQPHPLIPSPAVSPEDAVGLPLPRLRGLPGWSGGGGYPDPQQPPRDDVFV